MPTETWSSNEHKVGDTPLILYDSGGADGNAQAYKTGKILDVYKRQAVDGEYGLC